MTTQERARTLFIGVDVHKDTHTAVGVSPFGEKLFEATIGNYQTDFRTLIKKAESIGESALLSPYFGLEDCSGLGERLAVFLHESGYRVVHVPPVLVDEKRKRATHPEKNDSLDALGVAKVMMQSIDNLPAYNISEDGKKAKQIKEISQDREYLVGERTRLKNQLHGILHRIYNTGYKDRFKDPFSKKALRYWSLARPACDEILLRSMKRRVRRLIGLNEEIQELTKELEVLVAESGHTLTSASGCGVVIAAKIIGEVGDIRRFESPAALAKYAGCAPRERSSGKKSRHVKTMSGNRSLNAAFHQMALSQISRMGNPAGKKYFKKKIAEGKSKAQALACLRRQMVNIVWMMMKHKTEYRYPQA